MKLNATNQIGAGESLFEEGKADNCIYMVLKGKVILANRGASVVCGAGSLLEAEQLWGAAPFCACSVSEDASVYVIPADKEKSLPGLLSANKDYNGITVYNHARTLTELYKQQAKLKECASGLFNELKNDYDAFLNIAQENGCRTGLISEIGNLEEFVSGVNDTPDLAVLLEYARIPYDAVKSFYAYSSKLAIDEIGRMVKCEAALAGLCAEASDYVAALYDILAGNEENSLYRNLLGLAIDVKKKGGDTTKLNEMIARCRNYTGTVKALIGTQTTRSFMVNETVLNEMYEAYTSGGDFRTEDDVAGAAVEGAVASVVNSLKNTYEQLVEFAKYPEEKAGVFGELIEKFGALPDKESTEEEVRKLRKGIADHFYELYLLTAMESFAHKTLPKAVELFLDYGFISEKLITDSELVQLLEIKKTKTNSPCRVYSMTQWLKAVHDEEVEPSRNDLGQDYAEALREARKAGDITEAEAKELLQNPDKKVEYEIKNVMVHANRVVNGQLSIFVPMLYSGQLQGDLSRAYLSSEKLNYCVEDLTDIDYSVFYRESLYVDEEAGIEREYEMKNVYPIFINYPIVGENVVMWQEITGRKRDTEGRFFVPSFTFSSLNDMMIKAFGHFRWALCKTIQGVNWNNIQIRSLTAEYSDYIQFYKKNHDLSDERKEKIKLQIQRGRNNLRQVFTLDYEVWIKAESTGSVRLNKVVREMLATYCPFGAKVKEGVVRQPIFEEAFARNTRERARKVHELELRHKALEAKGIEVPEPLIKTLEFYKNM